MCNNHHNETKRFIDTINSINIVIENIENNIGMPSITGERYITDNELSKLLKIHKRTLIEYRHNKILPYYRIGHKIIYKESDIMLLLSKNYYSTKNANEY
jgi:hypothetical protein